MINGIFSQFSLKYAFASQAATAESDNCGMTQQMHSCSFKYIRQKYKYGHEKAREPCTRVRAQAEPVSIQVTTTENKEALEKRRWGELESRYNQKTGHPTKTTHWPKQSNVQNKIN